MDSKKPKDDLPKKPPEEPPKPPKPPRPPKPPKSPKPPKLPEIAPAAYASKPDPTVPSASTLRPSEAGQLDVMQTHTEEVKEPCCQRFKKFCYDKNARTFCGRTWQSWLKIIGYAIMYLIFLITYFNIMLYISLTIIKHESNPNQLSFSDPDYNFEAVVDHLPDTVGLTGTPLGEFSFPLIWYRNGESADYEKYMMALDELLATNRRKNDVGSKLGPCGQRPYGYGEHPCILMRINRQKRWAVRPLHPKSLRVKEAPEEVREWVMRDSKKYWLHCQGHQNYDKEHIGVIHYYPNPPGFDATLFPLKENSSVPLVAFQLSNFTMGISIAIQCSVWYEAGFSSIDFMLFISTRSKL